MIRRRRLSTKYSTSPKKNEKLTLVNLWNYVDSGPIKVIHYFQTVYAKMKCTHIMRVINPSDYTVLSLSVGINYWKNPVTKDGDGKVSFSSGNSHDQEWYFDFFIFFRILCI